MQPGEQTAGLCLVPVTTRPRHSGSGFWPGLEQNRTELLVTTRAASQLTGPVANTTHHGTNVSLPPPSGRWKGVTLDVIMDLPESTPWRYTGISVVVDWLTTMVIYPHCRKDITSPELARRFFEHVICKPVIRDYFVTDHRKEFTRRFWNQVCSCLSNNHRLSTAFHAQTDGHTTGQNQTMGLYLRAFPIYERHNCAELLTLAGFAYTVPFITQSRWHHSRPTSTTSRWCSSSYHTRHDTRGQKYWRTRRCLQWKRLTRFSVTTSRKPRYGSKSMPAERTQPSQLGT